MSAECLARLGAVVVLVVATGGAPTGSWQIPANPDAQTLADFRARVQAYVKLHRELEGTLPRLPEAATPGQIQHHRRALADLITKSRLRARQGDLFGPDMPALVQRLLAPVFDGSDGEHARAAIGDETPPGVPPVNTRYPEELPVSTMPPDVLKVLPELEEEIEYRFVGRHLILLDVGARLIADVLEGAIPA